MQKPTKLFLSLASCLMVTIITIPAPIVAIDLATIGAAYIVGLALQSAFSIGANLGQSSRRGKFLCSEKSLRSDIFYFTMFELAIVVSKNIIQLSGRGRYRSSYGRSYGRRSYGKREAEQILDENQVKIRVITN